MLLHLVNDEKIIDRVISIFEDVFPGCNRYIVFTRDLNRPFKYIKTCDNVDRFNVKNKNCWKNLPSLSLYSHILVHALSYDKAEFINRIYHPHISWLLWGADMYSLLLKDKGYQLYRDDNEHKRILKKSLFKIITTPIYKIYNKRRRRSMVDAIKKVETIYCIADDYKLLKLYYPMLGGKIVDERFFYYPIDQITSGVSIKEVSGDKIMIGHSASFTGNHKYILNLLHSLHILDNHESLVPLSYGNMAYASDIKNEIKNKGFKNITVLDRFMPLTEYYEVLASCQYFIYANLRQEGFGNILTALYLGGKVYLERENSIYNRLKNQGIIISLIDDLRNGTPLIPLTQDQKKHNREIIENLYSYAVLKSNMKECFG